MRIAGAIGFDGGGGQEQYAGRIVLTAAGLFFRGSDGVSIAGNFVQIIGGGGFGVRIDALEKTTGTVEIVGVVCGFGFVEGAGRGGFGLGRSAAVRIFFRDTFWSLV